MPRTDARRRGAGARAVWVLVLVLMGLPVRADAGDRPYGDRARPAHAAADRSHPVDRAAADAPAAASPGDGRSPGCRDGSRPDGGVVPATPPRGQTPGGPLPAAHDARGAAAPAGCGAWEPAATGPKRAPPALAPPSPMDLSILRV